jgi:hypothetical protein
MAAASPGILFHSVGGDPHEASARPGLRLDGPATGLVLWLESGIEISVRVSCDYPMTSPILPAVATWVC